MQQIQYFLKNKVNRTSCDLLLSVISKWWSIKNDYRTLIGLEDVDLVDTYAENWRE